MDNIVRQSDLFEDDYLIRTYSRISSSPDIALTELIANSWDAGALNVIISIPSNFGEELIVEDDGIGMTEDEFLSRWYKLGYNRVKHQGDFVIFPDGVEATPRRVYGRNGIGRHSLLCFNNTYKVETWRNGVSSIFTIITSSGESPISIYKTGNAHKQGHGTKLSVTINKNLPNEKMMLDILSARFIYDPQFNININKKSLDLENHDNIIRRLASNTEHLLIKNWSWYPLFEESCRWREWSPPRAASRQ